MRPISNVKPARLMTLPALAILTLIALMVTTSRTANACIGGHYDFGPFELWATGIADRSSDGFIQIPPAKEHNRPLSLEVVNKDDRKIEIVYVYSVPQEGKQTLVSTFYRISEKGKNPEVIEVRSNVIVATDDDGSVTVIRTRGISRKENTHPEPDAIAACGGVKKAKAGQQAIEAARPEAAPPQAARAELPIDRAPAAKETGEVGTLVDSLLSGKTVGGGRPDARSGNIPVRPTRK